MQICRYSRCLINDDVDDEYVSDTIHADSSALFAINIEILLDDVTKSDKSNIPPLTGPVSPVTSSVTSRSNIAPCLGKFTLV